MLRIHDMHVFVIAASKSAADLTSTWSSELAPKDEDDYFSEDNETTVRLYYSVWPQFNAKDLIDIQITDLDVDDDWVTYTQTVVWLNHVRKATTGRCYVKKQACKLKSNSSLKFRFASLG